VKRFLLCLPAFIVIAAAALCPAEILVLKSGEKMEGDVLLFYDKGILFREQAGSPGRYYPYSEVARISTNDDMLYYLMPRQKRGPSKRSFPFFPRTRILLPGKKSKAPIPVLRMPRGESVPVRCAGAEDAVTILLDGGARVRLLGLEPPPKSAGKRIAGKATGYVDSLVKGKEALLFPGPQGGASPEYAEAYVVVDNKLVNAETIENGWARVAAHAADHRYKEAFASLQKLAKNLGRGMWAVR